MATLSPRERPTPLAVEVDADDSPSDTAEFQITSVPTTLVFVDGVQRARLVGYKSADEVLSEVHRVTHAG